MGRGGEAIELFAGCTTQWRIAPTGKLMGLDYAGVAAVAAALSIDLDAEMLRMIQVLERHHVTGDDGAAAPACRGADACRMCRKPCNHRMTA